MTSRKMYVCYRTDETDAVEFWSFSKSVYDAFVETYSDSISRGHYKHVILPSHAFHDRFHTLDIQDHKLDIFDIDDQPLLATQFYFDMFWECSCVDEINSVYLSTYQLIAYLPKRLHTIIQKTMWNKHVPDECIDNVKLFYLMLHSYFCDKDVFEYLASNIGRQI